MSLADTIVLLVEEKFPLLGVNKKREIARLIWEIAKRDNIEPLKIITPFLKYKFAQLKAELLKIRYPQTQGRADYYLPKLESLVLPADTREKEFYPKNIFADANSLLSDVFKRAKEKFPAATISEINSVKDIVNGGFLKLNSYNNRTDNLFIVSETYDFFKNCPCTKNAVCCGYNLINLGFGCRFECSYCYLQSYQNFPGIMLQSNLSEYLRKLDAEKFLKGIFPYKRIGSGEFTDSLVFDDITNYSTTIVDYFRNIKDCVFEFKTKSSNIENLLSAKPSENIVVAWSVNPENMHEENEALSAPVNHRIACAAKCADYGYKIAFHFDPVIFYEGWENDYARLIGEIFHAVPKEKIAWISIGTLRFAPPLKKEIEKRFPLNTILDEEFIIDFDGKMRYPIKTRLQIYKKIISLLKNYAHKETVIYLCMESAVVWKESGI